MKIVKKFQDIISTYFQFETIVDAIAQDSSCSELGDS